MTADTLRPPTSQDPPKHHEPLLHVKAVETGVIDVRPVSFPNRSRRIARGSSRLTEW